MSLIHNLTHRHDVADKPGVGTVTLCYSRIRGRLSAAAVEPDGYDVVILRRPLPKDLKLLTACDAPWGLWRAAIELSGLAAEEGK